MNFLKCFVLFVLLGIATSPCPGQTWDALTGFAASNPNGVWSYGWGVTGTSFTLYTTYNTDCGDYGGVQGLVCWSAELYQNTPLVAFNTTGSYLNWWTVVDPPDALILHPAPDWEPGDSIVQWTAPVDGAYRISGFFEILDTNPTGITGLVYRNSTLLYSGTLTGPPAQHPDHPGGREDFYFPQVSLNAGDVISFGVNSDGTFYYDSTGFNAVIVTPPNAPPCAVCSQSGG
jgi:hypothetical protein